MPRSASFEVKIYRRDYRGNPTKWRVYVPEHAGGKGRDYYFRDEQAAISYAQGAAAAHHAKLAGLTTATPAQALEFQDCEKRAHRLGFATLSDALDHLENSNATNPVSPSLGDILDAFERNRSKNWTASTRSTWATCTKPFRSIRGLQAGELTAGFWEDWFNKHREKTAAASTFNRSINYLRGAYALAVDAQTLTANPIRNITRARSDLERDPHIVQAPAIAEFLRLAVLHHPETVPYWALCFFAGARPACEAYRVGWEHILWDRPNAGGGTGEIIIPKPQDRRQSATKTKRDRYVELEPCLRAWLEPYRRDKGPLAPLGPRSGKVSPQLIRHSRERIAWGHYSKDDTGQPVPVIEWGKERRDLTRHTYASAFAKAHAGETGVNSRLKDNMGHGSEATADRFYRNPHLTQEEAQAIMAIVPDPAQLERIRDFMQR